VHDVCGVETENFLSGFVSNAIRSMTLVEPAGTFLTFFGNTFAFFDLGFQADKKLKFNPASSAAGGRHDGECKKCSDIAKPRGESGRRRR